VAYTPAGLAHIALVPGDQMDVEVKNCLDSGGATVDADIVAIGSVVLLNNRLGLINGADERHVLYGRGLEPRRNVSSRYQERVAGQHRVGVPQAKHLIPVKKYAIF